MKNLYFKLLRLLNKGEPSRQEVEHVLVNHFHVNPALRSTETTQLMLVQYIFDHSLEEIATHHNVTRERVRQVIRKACRDARRKR